MTLVLGDRVVAVYGWTRFATCPIVPDVWGTIGSEPEPSGAHWFVHVTWDDGAESNSRVDLLERALKARGVAA